MNTTHLFVELLVIGVGGAVWLALIAVACVGYDPTIVENLLSMPAAAGPALAGVYLLGILTDRLADGLFVMTRTRSKIAGYFDSEDAYRTAMRSVLSTSPMSATQYEYNRSRQRICRGWVVNAALAALATTGLLLLRPPALADASRLLVFLTAMFSVLAVACWLAWERLFDTELKRIRDLSAQKR